MQLEFFDVPSPCVGVCESDEKGYCKGCMRSREERQQWINLDIDTKQKVIKRCIQRKKRRDAKPKAKEDVVETKKETAQPSLFDPPAKVTSGKSDDLDFGDFEL